MVQGYYNLQEAAEYLGISADALKQLAQRKEIRSFQDRGTLRFRIQDVQELARMRGGDSDPELSLGEASLPPAKQPTPGPKTPSMKKKEAAPEVFSFDFDADKKDPASGVLAGGSKSKATPKSDAKKSKPVQPAGSDSDVRLVAEGSVVGFSVAKDSGAKLGSDSDVKVRNDPTSKSSKRPAVPGAPKSPGPKSPKAAGSGAQPVDSGVRLVPMDSDSDVKILGSSDEVSLGDPVSASQSDSNVRLEKVPQHPGESGEGTLMLTEEINLDEEVKKQEAKDKAKQPTKIKAKSELKFPTSSPFELSDSDLEMPSELKTTGKKDPKKDSSDFDLAAQKEGSSDFDLVPNDDGSILLEGEGDFSLELNDENQVDVLEGNEPELTGPTSGISLGNPVDAGVSLEGNESDDSLDFDLSLEPSATPRPDRGSPLESSDSEFELSLDLSDGGKSADDSDSEFELSLDAGGGVGNDSDSEFELTLDDSGNLAAAPQVKASAKEEDIFETDFEVPALEGEASGSEDTDLESSDFDLALDDSEVVPEDESGSHVVALDEEEVDSDDAAEVEVEEDEKEGFAEIEEEDDDDVGKGGPVREVVREKILQPAPWGVLPVIFMIPCVFTMILVAFMGFEAVMTGNGFKAPMFFTKLVGENVMNQKFPPNFPQRP